MKNISLLLLLSIVTYSVGAEPFSYLKKEKLENVAPKWMKYELAIHYDPKLFKRVYKKRIEYPKGHPFYTDEFGSDDVVLGIFDLTGKGDRYFVTISLGPSLDVSYCFNNEVRLRKAVKNKKTYIRCDSTISALSVVIPGNGNIYSYGHNNTMADTREKYKLKNGKLKLLSQPFSYVGKKTTSLKDQIVYTDESLKVELFRLTKGYPVTIVGIKNRTEKTINRKDFFLVASEFGLVGWVPVEMSQKESQFSGFFFYGD